MGNLKTLDFGPKCHHIWLIQPYSLRRVVGCFILPHQITVIIMINYNHHEAWWDIHELTGAPPQVLFFQRNGVLHHPSERQTET